MRIAFIASNFPSPSRPFEGTFIQQFVWAMARQVNECSVIKPTSILARRYGSYPPAQTVEDAGGGNTVRVYRPSMLSLSSKQFGPLNTFTLTHFEFRRAVWRALRRLPERPDALYGHFLYSPGEAAVWAGARIGLPGFVAVGEGTFWTLRPLGVERARRDFVSMAGAIAVSTVLRERLIRELRFPSDKVAVFPNGVDRRRFHQYDQQEMRSKHGLPTVGFLVIYVGSFIECKGVNRVAAAIDHLPGVQGLFVGAGPSNPRIGNLAFCGSVSHDVVPELLSAADCFVLPSDVEGCSNAALEAMACGLPIITSSGRYMDDIVDDSVAIRVDPMDVGQIHAAIQVMVNDPERRARMSRASLERANRFDINERAKRVTEWMEGIVMRRRGIEEEMGIP